MRREQRVQEEAWRNSRAMAAQDAEVRPHPLRGLLQVFRCSWSGRWLLLHSLSCELAALPAELEGATVHEWELAFDEGGFAILLGRTSPNDWAALAPQDVLKGDVVQDASGRPLLMLESGRARFVCDLRASCTRRTLSATNAGLQRVSWSIPAAIFDTPRACGSRVMWNLPSLFDAIGGAAAGHKRSKWLHKMLPAWERLMSSHFGADCILRAQPYARQQPAPADAARRLRYPWRPRPS